MKLLIYSLVLTNDRQQQLNDQLTTMTGFEGANLKSVVLDQISVVVSEIKKTDLAVNQTNAILFAEKIDQLNEHFTLLPMRFGSSKSSIDSISEMLRLNYQEFISNLLKVENKIEFGLKIFYDHKSLLEFFKLEQESESEKQIDSIAAQKVSVYKDYINKKLKTHRIEQKLVSFSNDVTTDFVRKISLWNTEIKIKKIVSETIIADVVFLLDKTKKKELVQVINSLQTKYPMLSFVVTGPWPPYNFVDITLK